MNSRSFLPNRDLRRLPVAVTAATFIGCATIAIGLSGCGSEPEEAVVAAPAYTPPPPMPDVPKVTPIKDLMAQLRIDDRIMLSEDKAPDNDPARKAVLEFFDGFARGDANAVRNMVTGLDRRELDAMVEAGQWHRTIEGIASIEIETGAAVGSGRSGGGQNDIHHSLFTKSTAELQGLIETGEFRQLAKSAGMRDDQIDRIESMVGMPEWDSHVSQAMESLASMPAAATPALYEGEQCALALFMVDGEYQVQMWYYQRRGDRFEFQSAPTPPDMVNRLSGTNWIKAWHDIIDYELMLASKPDETIAPPQRSLDEGDDSPGGPSGPSPTGPGPRGPTGPPPPPVEVPSGPTFKR